jgi:hypothetical protein
MAKTTLIQSKASRLTKAERAQLTEELAVLDETIHQLNRDNAEYGGPSPMKSFIGEIPRSLIMHEILALE